MVNYVFGVVNSDGIHTDVSKSERGAKRYATLNGYDKVSVRYNLGNVVEIVAEKINKKWVDVL
jgi:hypothetical protein